MNILLAAVVASTISTADSDLTGISTCIAYDAVMADNAKQPYPERMGAMVAELEMVAAMEGIQQQDARMMVAVALVAMNAQAAENGLESIEETWSASCDEISSKLG